MKTKEEYEEEIIKLLDEAASDDELSLPDYADLCAEIADAAGGRAEGAQNDLDAPYEE